VLLLGQTSPIQKTKNLASGSDYFPDSLFRKKNPGAEFNSRVSLMRAVPEKEWPAEAGQVGFLGK